MAGKQKQNMMKWSQAKGTIKMLWSTLSIPAITVTGYNLISKGRAEGKMSDDSQCRHTSTQCTIGSLRNDYDDAFGEWLLNVNSVCTSIIGYFKQNFGIQKCRQK